MSASTLSSAMGDILMDADSQFNVMLVYANVETGWRGKEMHARVVKQFVPECNLTLRLW